MFLGFLYICTSFNSIYAMTPSNESCPQVHEKHYWFVFHDTGILLEKKADGTFAVPFCETPPFGLQPTAEPLVVDVPPAVHLPSGVGKGKTFLATTMPAADVACEAMTLRQSFHHLPHPFYLVAGKCSELIYWDRHSRFCSICGAPMQWHTDISKRCPQCGNEIWPQLATAIIVLIRRKSPDGDPSKESVLLVHANNFRSNYYGLVAGFVETGETLEEAVRREVMEEVGLRIDNIRYFASQPWPYPCGLMVGFTADYVSGDIRLQRSELGDGGWYTRATLPAIPDKLSIARRLIDYWVEHP